MTAFGSPFLSISSFGRACRIVGVIRDRPGMSAEQIIDRLDRFAEQGVTVSAVPIPAVRGVDEYLDYAQQVMGRSRRPSISWSRPAMGGRASHALGHVS